MSPRPARQELPKGRRAHNDTQSAPRFQLQVGEAWPGEISITAETAIEPEHRPRMRAVGAVLVFGIVLVTTITIHAMVTGNQHRIDTILAWSLWIVLIVAIWATALHKWPNAKGILREVLRSLKE